MAPWNMGLRGAGVAVRPVLLTDGSAVASRESLRERPLLLAQQGAWTKGELLSSAWLAFSERSPRVATHTVRQSHSSTVRTCLRRYPPRAFAYL